MSQQSEKRWLMFNNYCTNGMEAELPKLTLKQATNFIKALENKYYANTQEIIALCQNMFGITYTKTGMIDWLYRNDFNYIEPTKVLPNRSKESQVP